MQNPRESFMICTFSVKGVGALLSPRRGCSQRFAGIRQFCQGEAWAACGHSQLIDFTCGSHKGSLPCMQVEGCCQEVVGMGGRGGVA